MGMSRMRIGFFGDGPWSHLSFRKLNQDPTFQVVFVAVRAKSPDLALARLAEQSGLPVYIWPDVNAGSVIQQIVELKCDLLISMSFDQIIRKQLMELPRLGFINCHAGKLPFYRGRNVLNWALINGETEFAVTVHFVDGSIDTGDIIQQDLVPILPGDDYADVLAKASSQCSETLYAAVGSIRDSVAQRIVQQTIHTTGFYCKNGLPLDHYWVAKTNPDYTGLPMRSKVVTGISALPAVFSNAW